MATDLRFMKTCSSGLRDRFADERNKTLEKETLEK